MVEGIAALGFISWAQGGYGGCTALLHAHAGTRRAMGMAVRQPYVTAIPIVCKGALAWYVSDTKNAFLLAKVPLHVLYMEPSSHVVGSDPSTSVRLSGWDHAHE